jgi:hypothetical protein
MRFQLKSRVSRLKLAPKLKNCRYLINIYILKERKLVDINCHLEIGSCVVTFVDFFETTGSVVEY